MGYDELKKEIRDKRLGISNKSNVSNSKESCSDDYGIDEKWQKIRRLIEKTEPRCGSGTRRYQCGIVSSSCCS